MNKNELVAKVAEAASLSLADATRVVEAVVATVQEELSSGNEVSIHGFGKFSTSQRAARKGRNPSTGAEIDIAASTVAKFSPAKALKDAVNKAD